MNELIKCLLCTTKYQALLQECPTQTKLLLSNKTKLLLYQEAQEINNEAAAMRIQGNVEQV